jgi:hypothetical protein
VKLLLERGADGTKVTLDTFAEGRTLICGPSTAVDIARRFARHWGAEAKAVYAVLAPRCCSACGVTSSALSAATPGVAPLLKRCSGCPSSGPSAHYCSVACQREDWPARHRGECGEAGAARERAREQTRRAAGVD